MFTLNAENDNVTSCILDRLKRRLKLLCGQGIVCLVRGLVLTSKDAAYNPCYNWSNWSFNKMTFVR